MVDRRPAGAALAFLAAACVLLTLAGHGGNPAGGTARAEREFDGAAARDAALDRKPLQRIAAIDHKLAEAQRRLREDQSREKHLLHRLDRAGAPAVVARSRYRVDVGKGSAKTVTNGYRQQGWPRGFSAGRFDLPPQRGEFQGVGPVVEAIGGMGGGESGLTPGEKLADLYLLSRHRR